MLLGEVERAHWPFLVAFKCVNRVSVAVFHSFTRGSVEHGKHFQEWSPNLFNIAFFVFSVELTDFFESCICSVLILLGVVDRLFDTDRAVKVDVRLLQLVHGTVYLLHKQLRVLKGLISLCKDLVFENSNVSSLNDLGR